MNLLRIAVVFLTCSINLTAQNKSDTTIKKDQIKAGIIFLGAGLNYEKRISHTSTLNLNAEMSYAFGHNSASYYLLTPVFSFEGRNYYNISKRFKKGKQTSNNAGNFFAIAAGVKTTPIISNQYSDPPLIFWIPSWGIQRSLGKKFTFSSQFGWAFKYSNTEKKWSSSPNIRAGIYFILK